MSNHNMKKTEKERIRKEIGNTMFYWLDILKFSGYSLYTLFPEDEGWEESSTGGLSVKLEYPYKVIHLSVPQDYIDNYKLKESNIKDSLLHEAIHVLMWKLSHLAQSRWCTFEQLDSCEEELTDHITNVISELVKK